MSKFPQTIALCTRVHPLPPPPSHSFVTLPLAANHYYFLTPLLQDSALDNNAADTHIDTDTDIDIDTDTSDTDSTDIDINANTMTLSKLFGGVDA